MLQITLAYLQSLGPYAVAALLLGVAIPLILIVAQPFRWIIALGTLTLCLVPFGSANVAAGSEGSLLRQAGWGFLFLISAILATRGQDGCFRFDWKLVPPIFALLIGFAALSVIWADNSQVSARRVIQLFGVFLIALALVRHRNDQDAFLKFAGPGFLFLLFGGLAVGTPSLSFDTDGNYKGFTYTKNNWGQFAAFMALTFLYGAISGYKARRNWILFGFATLSLLSTRSATSIAIYALAVGIILSWSFGKRYGRVFQLASLGIAIVSVGASFAYFIVQGELPLDRLLSAGLGSVGKDTTLTGRTALWQMMGLEIARHPWLGIGYGSFWLGLEGQSVSIVRFFTWLPGQAHNGYIDVVNEIGLIGLGLLLATLLTHLYKLLQLYRAGKELPAVFHFALLAAALALNISESSLLRTTHIWWIILTISIVEVHARQIRLGNTSPLFKMRESLAHA